MKNLFINYYYFNETAIIYLKILFKKFFFPRTSLKIQKCKIKVRFQNSLGH